MHIYIYIYTAGCSSYPMLWISMDMYRQSMAEAGPVISTSVALVADRKNKKIPHKKSASTYRESCWLPISLISKTWLFPRSIAIICFLFHLFFFLVVSSRGQKKMTRVDDKITGSVPVRERVVCHRDIDRLSSARTHCRVFVSACSDKNERKKSRRSLIHQIFCKSLFSLSISTFFFFFFFLFSCSLQEAGLCSEKPTKMNNLWWAI